jgi:hypothetical protein
MTFQSDKIIIVTERGIAQFGSAPALGAGGRGFKSLCPDHIKLTVAWVYSDAYAPVAQLDRASAF